jgi:hypothetical protein
MELVPKAEFSIVTLEATGQPDIGHKKDLIGRYSGIFLDGSDCHVGLNVN